MSSYYDRLASFRENNVVTDDDGCELSPLDDDYYYHKTRLRDKTNPLSDDYVKCDY